MGYGTIYRRVYFSCVRRDECRPAGFHGALPGLDPARHHGRAIHSERAYVQGKSHIRRTFRPARSRHPYRSARLTPHAPPATLITPTPLYFSIHLYPHNVQTFCPPAAGRQNVRMTVWVCAGARQKKAQEYAYPISRHLHFYEYKYTQGGTRGCHNARWVPCPLVGFDSPRLGAAACQFLDVGAHGAVRSCLLAV